MNEDTIDMLIMDLIPYIQNYLFSKIPDTSENPYTPEVTPSLSTQAYLIETPKKANDASINSNQIDQSELFSDKIYEI